MLRLCPEKNNNNKAAEFIIKPEPCGGGLIGAQRRSPAFTAALSLWPWRADSSLFYQISLRSPGEGQGILSITAKVCKSEAASKSSRELLPSSNLKQRHQQNKITGQSRLCWAYGNLSVLDSHIGNKVTDCESCCLWRKEMRALESALRSWSTWNCQHTTLKF